MTTNKPRPNTAKPKYEPTATERSALGKYDSRKATQTAPRLKVLKSGEKVTISPDHPDQPVGWSLLMEALGTADVDFAKGLIQQLAGAGLKDGQIDNDGQIDEAGVNFLLSVVKDAKPKDHLEAMLVAQMAVVHVITMAFARRLPHVETLQEQDSAERALNKLARTFTIQLEARTRYRTGGEPQVMVQNVSVREGGQAILGNVTQAARETAPDRSATSPPALTDARMAPMPMVDNQERAPVASRRKRKDAKRSPA
jgi:hypothetical protein